MVVTWSCYMLRDVLEYGGLAQLALNAQAV